MDVEDDEVALALLAPDAVSPTLEPPHPGTLAFKESPRGKTALPRPG